MKEVCQDMFFSRTRNLQAAQGSVGARSHSRAALEQMLTGSLSPDDRINAIHELIDIRVESPTRLDFSDKVRKEKAFRFLTEKICLKIVAWKHQAY